MSWRARMTPNLKQIMVMINPKDPMCFGVRNWWRKNIPEMQLLNPKGEYTMQEMSFGEPHLYLLYNQIDSRLVRLAGCTEEEMEEIMEAAVVYANTHAIPDKAQADDNSDGSTIHQLVPILSFGYAENFLARLEPNLRGQASLDKWFLDSVDDPGQKAKVLPNNHWGRMLQ